jgi:antitoxin component YwqK of YwqJK toxin-antitoxin module
VVGGIGWIAWKWYGAKGISGDAFSLIPSDAIYCIATNHPIKMWKDVSESKTWQHLQKNSSFAHLTSAAESLSALVKDSDLLVNLVGSTTAIASAHMTGPKKYDFLFLIDLQNASGIKFLNEYLTSFNASEYSVRKQKYKEENIFILYNEKNKSLMYLGTPGSYLVTSFSQSLLTKALDLNNGEHQSSKELFFAVDDEPEKTDKLKFYINYSRLPQFMSCYSDGKNEYVSRIAQMLRTSSMEFTIEDEILRSKGQTLINDTIASYVRTLASSGKGASGFLEVAPQRTAFFLSMGFNSFGEFFKNFENNLQKDVTEYANYKANMKQVESYLNISLQETVISWIGDEVAVLEMQSAGLGLDNETAVLLKADNIEKALSNLSRIEKMVRRKTPVKFKTVDYKGYSIRYLGVKNLFKVMLGKFFARYDKPYYTVISNYVVFSAHPQVLESMIDDYSEKRTLARDDDFRSFRNEFDNESAAFIYANTPVLFNSMKTLADLPTRTSMDTNKDYIVCFRQIGFQLVPDKEGFKTLFLEKFVEPEGAKLQSNDSSSTVKASLEKDTTKKFVKVDMVEDVASDPMELPYIYAKNVNAKFYEAFFADSTTHYKVGLKGGFKDGSYKEYYPNGEVKMTGQFRKDKRDGTWRLYDETGKQILKRIYDEGMVTKEKTN